MTGGDATVPDEAAGVVRVGGCFTGRCAARGL